MTCDVALSVRATSHPKFRDTVVEWHRPRGDNFLSSKAATAEQHRDLLPS